MAQNDYDKLCELTDRLNRYRDEYYNKNAPSVSDEVYDVLFDDLCTLEQSLGIRMANSPTQTVGAPPAVSKLEKTTHSIPLLSLDKTKSSMELLDFQGQQQILLMLKLDGLTVKLTYEDGHLVEAATRGDGNVGEIVTHNICGISGIPAVIPYKQHLVVTGEAFIHTDDFEQVKGDLLDSSGKPYRNSRNLAAGSVRLLDAAECRKRKVSFMPFNVLEGFDTESKKSRKLFQLRAHGFKVCYFLLTNSVLSQGEIEDGIRQLREYAKENSIPIDGVVMTYNDIAYSKQCGRTGHHYKDGIAYKFQDELYETVLRGIEWNPSRTGEMTPVAVFDTVEIDGRAISRASLHNLSNVQKLALVPGNRIMVSTRNMIIPHVEYNLDAGHFEMAQVIPRTCPCCGSPICVRVNKAEQTMTVHCKNESCDTRRLRQFVHFVSQKAMNIEGLSEATLEKLIGKGWVHSYMDLYRLDAHAAEIVKMDGFGEKSWANLWAAIQKSRNTTFERFLIGMDIPMIGNTASRVLCQKFRGSLDAFEDAVNSNYDFSALPDFGQTLNTNIHDWFSVEENWYIWEEMKAMMNIQQTRTETAVQSGPFVGCTIVVTGKVEPYTRNGINAMIESLGAHAGSAVSRNTDYLVCGENAGSKLAKAKALGVKVLTPEQFFAMANA